MRELGPLLVPGFVPVACEGDPWATAVRMAQSDADPGIVVHGELARRCRMAVILAPDRATDDAEMLELTAHAVQEALASLAPVGIPVEIAAPRNVSVNGAEVAVMNIHRPAGRPDVIPEWLVAGIDVAVDLQDADPGLYPGRTCLAEEGFAVTAGEVMAAICRYLLAGIDGWTEAGHRLASARAVR